jgi:cysteinyl-tRNA synthetase
MKTNNIQELRKKLSSQKVRSGVLNHQFMSSVKWTQLKICMLTGQLRKLLGNIHKQTVHELDTVENLDPSIFAAKANSEDTPTYEEAMNGPLAEDLRISMVVEWDMLNVVTKAWKIVERQPWMNVLPSTWSLRCKRFPDGLIRKLKARLCARGGKQM